MKKFITVFLVTIMFTCCFLTFAGCRPGGNGGSSGEDGELTGSIKVWWPGGSPATEAAIYLAKERYEAAHEGVTVNIVTQSTSDFYASYNMALMGTDFPDIAYVDHVYVQRLAFDRLIADLSRLGVDAEKDKFIESLWKTTQYENVTYALPMSANVLTMAYNKALLGKVLGREFTESDYPVDWDSFIALGDRIEQYNIANSLTGNDKLYLTTVPAGTGAESMGAMFFMAYSAREGGTLMNEALTEMTVNTAPNKRAAAKIRRLGELGYTPTNFSESKFETGKVAFIEMGPWKLVDYSRISQANDNCDIRYGQIFPMNAGGATYGALGLYSLVVTRKSAKRALAADFIRYVSTDTEIQLAHNTVQNLMPVTAEAIADEFYATEEWKVFVDQLRDIVARPGSAAWPAIQRTLAEYVTDLVAGGKNGYPDYLDAIKIRLDETIEDLDDE